MSIHHRFLFFPLYMLCFVRSFISRLFLHPEDVRGFRMTRVGVHIFSPLFLLARARLESVQAFVLCVVTVCLNCTRAEAVG